jgi:hypothetical protein
MVKLVKWEVGIEYGPTSADVHYETVEATSLNDALNKGKLWAYANGMRDVIVCNASELHDDSLSDNDDFIGDVNWTEEEEEEFTRITNNQGFGV